MASRLGPQSQSSQPAQTYHKAIAAALAAGFTILAGFGVDVGAWSSTEITAALSTLIGAALVYFIPNHAKD